MSARGFAYLCAASWSLGIITLAVGAITGTVFTIVLGLVLAVVAAVGIVILALKEKDK